MFNENYFFHKIYVCVYIQFYVLLLKIPLLNLAGATASVLRRTAVNQVKRVDIRGQGATAVSSQGRVIKCHWAQLFFLVFFWPKLANTLIYG